MSLQAITRFYVELFLDLHLSRYVNSICFHDPGLLAKPRRPFAMCTCKQG